VRAARQRAAGLRHLHVHVGAPRQALKRKQRGKRAEWTHRLRTRSAKKVVAPFRVQITMSCVEGPFSKVKCLVHLLNKDTVESTFENVCRLRGRRVRVGDLPAELRHALLQHLLREQHLVDLLRRHECRKLDICLGWHPAARCSLRRGVV